MKIRAIGSNYEILHLTKILEKSKDYVNTSKPSEIILIEDGVDAGSFRRHFNLKPVYRPTQSKKQKKQKKR